MYGTIFHLRPRPGREREVIALFEEWGRTRGPRVKGARGGYLMRPNERSDELTGVAVFADRATYEANANDPEQDRWYRQMRELLYADPTWEDGEYLAGGIVNFDAIRLVTANLEAFNAHDLDAGARTVAPNAENVDVPTGTTVIGPNGLRGYWQGWLTAFPDGKVEIVRLEATEEGTVVTEFIGRGTHRGPLLGPGGRQIPPSGRSVEVHFCQIATVRDNLITGAKLYYDLTSLLTQVGALPELQ